MKKVDFFTKYRKILVLAVQAEERTALHPVVCWLNAYANLP